MVLWFHVIESCQALKVGVENQALIRLLCKRKFPLVKVRCRV
jgi:hypothetical protein